MFVLIGLAIVFGSLLFGFTHSGGKVAALIQISEFIIIGGAAFGAVVIAYTFKGAISTMKACIGLLKGNPYTTKMYLELLHSLYEIFVVARKDGLLSLEKHVENPHESDLFQKYPTLLNNHHAIAFCTDTLKVIIMGGVNIHDLSELMDLDLEAQEEESLQVSQILSTISDSMPGFGIVAAVLGVVITMQSIGGPPEVVGEKVGAALVGTFLGVLLAYGIFAPLAKATEVIAKAECQYLACMKHSLVAFARGDTPVMCVEFARRSIDPEARPSFSELENACRNRNKEEPAAETQAAA